ELAVERAAAERGNTVDVGVLLGHDDLEAVGDDAVLVVDGGLCGAGGTEDEAEHGGAGDGGVTSGLEATRLDSHDYSVFRGGDVLPGVTETELEGPDLAVGGDVVAVRGDDPDERTDLDSTNDTGGCAVDVRELDFLEVTVEVTLGDDELL